MAEGVQFRRNARFALRSAGAPLLVQPQAKKDQGKTMPNLGSVFNASTESTRLAGTRETPRQATPMALWRGGHFGGGRGISAPATRQLGRAECAYG